MAFKVALLGIYHESNTFITTTTTLDDFKNGHWLKGVEIKEEYLHAHHEIGGMLEVMDREGIEVVPVMFAKATPGGIIAADTYHTLLHEMMNLLEEELPVDGCLVIPHGAAVSERYPDMDGHWLQTLRDKLGEDIPVVGTLDPHANVSPLMASVTNALVAYKTNPHIDQRETGQEAAEIMVKILRQQCKPVQRLFQLPLAISIEQQHTGAEPCKSLFAAAKEWRARNGLLSASILLGFPYADVREMGTSILVISDNNAEIAQEAGNQFVSMILDNKQAFNSSKKDINVLWPVISNSKKPVLLLDMGDNVGGGAPGNSTHLLKALSQEKNCPFFICLYDPLAVATAAKQVAGAYFNISIQEDVPPDDIYSCEVKLIRLADGKFREANPRHGGQVNFDMGKIAIVTTNEQSVIMFTSLRTLPFSLRQLTAFDIDPAGFDVIVAKGVNAPVAAYGSVCPTILQVDTPGVTQADMTAFQYHNRRIPMFPFE